jgi:hypothetical protein
LGLNANDFACAGGVIDVEGEAHITDFFQFFPGTDIKPAGQKSVDFLRLLKLYGHGGRGWICCYQPGQVKSRPFVLFQTGAIY